MKRIILAIVLLAFGVCVFAVETQKVCMEQTNAKTQKTRRVCKQVKVHKKLEVTTIPDKKAK